MKNKTLKRILSAAIIASALMLPCVCAQAAKAPKEGSAEAASENAYYYTQLEEKEKAIYEEIYTNLYKDSAEWTTDCHIAADRYIEILDLVLNDHPEIFWVGSKREAAQDKFSGVIYGMTYTPIVGNKARDNMKKQIDAGADMILSTIFPSLSDYDKCRFVYEAIINQVEYDLNAPDNQNIQSALVNHRSVCAGYAKTFQYLMQKLGFECIYVTGSVGEELHAWNIVKIGESYYHVDCTWGDPAYYSSKIDQSSSSLIDYNYLCCTTEAIGATHAAEWTMYPACVDDSLNYYKTMNLYFDEFDPEVIGTLIESAARSQHSGTMFQIGSEEGYQAALDSVADGSILTKAQDYLATTGRTEPLNVGYTAESLFHSISIAFTAQAPSAAFEKETEISIDLNDPEIIKKVQQALNENGFDCGEADGIAGSKTAEAITAFQTDRGIDVNGTITPEVVSALGIG